MHINKITFTLALALSLFIFPGKTLAQTPPPPDCVRTFDFTGDGSGTQVSTTFDNRFIACQTWTVDYQATATSGSITSLTFQTAPGAVTVGSWSTYAGTVVTGINPNTSSTGAVTKFNNGAVVTPWVRVLFTEGTFVGRLTGTIYGYKTGYAGSAPPGGFCPGATVNTEILFNDANTCGGNLKLAWTNSTETFKIGNSTSNLLVETNGDAASLQFVTMLGNPPSDTTGATGNTGNGFDMEAPRGANTTRVTTGTGGLGGSFTMAAGNGGTAALAATASTGGGGGEFDFLSGQGAAASVANSTNTGGNGGDFNVSASKGGNAAGTGTALNTGGNGGNINLIAAARGTASGGAMNTNGVSGNIFATIQNLSDSRFAVRANSADLFASNNQYTNSAVHYVSSGSAPAIAGCSATIVATATDNAGKVTSGTAGGCTAILTFATAWTIAPACTVTNETEANQVTATTTTTTLTLNGVTASSDVLGYVCMGNV